MARLIRPPFAPVLRPVVEASARADATAPRPARQGGELRRTHRGTTGDSPPRRLNAAPEMRLVRDMLHGGEPEAVLEATSAASKPASKPVVASVVRFDGRLPARTRSAVPNFLFPESCAAALARRPTARLALATARSWRRSRSEPPRRSRPTEARTSRLPAVDNASGIESVAVVGAGLMGSGIAEAVAVAGVPVVLRDVDEVSIGRARDRIESSLARAVGGGKLDAARARPRARADRAHDRAGGDRRRGSRDRGRARDPGSEARGDAGDRPRRRR